jgi:hypothetical protein
MIYALDAMVTVFRFRESQVGGVLAARQGRGSVSTTHPADGRNDSLKTGHPGGARRIGKMIAQQLTKERSSLAFSA